MEQGLLHLLHGDARCTNAALARSLGVSRKQVEYAIARLGENGVIRGSIARIRQSQFCNGIALILWTLKHPARTRQALIDDLASDSRINWIASVEGTCHLACTAQFDHAQELQRVLDAVASRNEGLVVSTRTVIYAHEWFFDRAGLVGVADKTASNALGGLRVELSTTDREVLAILAADARASNASVGRACGISSATAARTVASLRKRGVLQGSTIVLDPRPLGRSGVLIELQADARGVQAVVEVAARAPQVTHCASMIGESSLVLTAYVDSLAGLYALLDEISEAGGAAVRGMRLHHLRAEHLEFFVRPERIARAAKK